MKKTVFIPVLIVLLLLTGAACAEGPVNANQQQVREHDRRPRPLTEYYGDQEGNLQPNGSGTGGSISMIQTPTLDGEGVWSLTCYRTGGTPVGVTAYLTMKDFSSNYTTVYMHKYDDIPATVSSCRIVTGGEYEFSVWIQYEDGRTGYAGADYFTIRDDDEHTSLQERVKEIVSECKAGTKWKTALNLHDWLIYNVYYDQNYEYYGADMMLRGYGVCDGYSKAFHMLCERAGIPVTRAVNKDHAWNAIQIGEEWYFVDCTWDDPIGGPQEAVSGYEGHTYFCVNEAMLSTDHPKPWNWEGTQQECTALYANYTYRSGEWEKWGPGYEWVEEVCTVTPFTDLISGDFSLGEQTAYFQSGGDVWWTTGSEGNVYGFGPDEYKVTILVYALNQKGVKEAGTDETFTVDATSFGRYKDQNLALYVKLTGWKIEETGTLLLPQELAGVSENAFAGTGATTLEIQPGCGFISDGAFRDSAIRTATIPDTVAWIAEDAFEGCGRLIFKTNNETAIQYAQEHGIIVISN